MKAAMKNGRATWRTAAVVLPAALSVIAATFISTSACAATSDNNAQAEHAGHHEAPAGTSTASSPPPMTPSAASADAGAPMEHGDMKMQGGPAPADARDPHAYSGGYTLDSGPYALPGPRQLRLADEHNFASLLVDRLEWVDTNPGTGDYDAIAWFGNSYNRLVLKAEGAFSSSELLDARTELLWGHAVATYWDTQLGVRNDSGEGPSRNWLAFGVQGLAPYWFELDITGYVGNDGRTALRASAEYELLLTQRWILQPRAEMNLYGKDDVENGIGSGLSDVTVGLRLRYEVTRQFAPYIGVAWGGKFGQTADLAQAAGEKTRETSFVAGVRFWF
jgi:copper resistance protein B